MKLDADTALDRLRTHHHGVLATTNGEGAVDLVPVVYALEAGRYRGIPIDRVKSKSGGVLQRERNLEKDARATLLVEQWSDSDWSQLWWVRGRLRWLRDPDAALTASLGGVRLGAVLELVDVVAVTRRRWNAGTSRKFMPWSLDLWTGELRKEMSLVELSGALQLCLASPWCA
ncbi:pyridoxamine 5'-phosphate oxidase family protein [Gordonia hydrophobica]|uniref:Pyridoxamine 5'-phosphate oxidase family protein n=1 Tax=Gordonia hydrophobica TaxID=40516 RepID=A0ABZ2U5L5_9ACTN|nr:pyridoxamine 5'-phosphate oxidase family protein [Gordonia hydrophobica]MBM7369540.1 hypothetical protein [Gordonia hydrophobica]